LSSPLAIVKHLRPPHSPSPSPSSNALTLANRPRHHRVTTPVRRKTRGPRRRRSFSRRLPTSHLPSSNDVRGTLEVSDLSTRTHANPVRPHTATPTSTTSRHSLQSPLSSDANKEVSTTEPQQHHTDAFRRHLEPLLLSFLPVSFLSPAGLERSVPSPLHEFQCLLIPGLFGHAAMRRGRQGEYLVVTQARTIPVWPQQR
jgi:hypothetical protein